MRYAALLIPSHAVDAEESEEREEACSHRWQEEEARKTQQERAGGEETAAGGRGEGQERIRQTACKADGCGS